MNPRNALERAREEKQAHGELETEHLGYLDSQDTYCKIALVKPYCRKYARVCFGWYG